MPDRMTVDRDEHGRLYYEYLVYDGDDVDGRTGTDPKANGKIVRLHPADVLHIPYDLTVRIPPQKQMRHQSLPEHKRSHLRIRLIMQQKIERMIHRLFLTAIIVIPVKLQWQALL